MTTISSLQNSASTYQNDVSEVSSAAKASTDKTSDSESTSEKSDISLSTRAQKIQALNEEFFPAGPSSVTISDAFIARLKEYGLISSDDAQQLTSSLSNNTDSNTNDTVALKELATETENLISVLQQDEANEDSQKMASKLGDALDILNTFDQFNSNAIELNNLSDEIKQFRLSDAASQLSSSDQQTLKNLELTLSVAAKLNPETISSSAINQYLTVNDL